MQDTEKKKKKKCISSPEYLVFPNSLKVGVTDVNSRSYYLWISIVITERYRPKLALASNPLNICKLALSLLQLS